MSEEEKRERRRIQAAEKRANETPEQREARNSVRRVQNKTTENRVKILTPSKSEVF